MKEDSNKLKEYLIDCFGVWKYVDPELVARVTPSSEWVEIPEGSEYMTVPNNYFWRGGNEHNFWNGWEWSCNCGETMQDYLARACLARVAWKRDKLQETVGSGNVIKPVKSDGGSSSYYFTALPEHLIKDIVKRGGIEIKDIVRYCFDNDADCKDIIKALKRIRENLKGGGKEGVDSIYDANKICFFAEELRSSLKECSKNV